MSRLSRTSSCLCLCSRSELFGDGYRGRPGRCLMETDTVAIGRDVAPRQDPPSFASLRGGPEPPPAIYDELLVGAGVHVYAVRHAFNGVAATEVRPGPPQGASCPPARWPTAAAGSCRSRSAHLKLVPDPESGLRFCLVGSRAKRCVGRMRCRSRRGTWNDRGRYSPAAGAELRPSLRPGVPGRWVPDFLPVEVGKA